MGCFYQPTAPEHAATLPHTYPGLLYDPREASGKDQNALRGKWVNIEVIIVAAFGQSFGESDITKRLDSSVTTQPGLPRQGARPCAPAHLPTHELRLRRSVHCYYSGFANTLCPCRRKEMRGVGPAGRGSRVGGSGEIMTPTVGCLLRQQFVDRLDSVFDAVQRLQQDGN